MKKLTALIVTLTLLFSLSACGASALTLPARRAPPLPDPRVALVLAALPPPPYPSPPSRADSPQPAPPSAFGSPPLSDPFPNALFFFL